MLPRLKKIDRVALHTLVTQRGISAEHSQETFGFAHADTDVDAIFGNPDINAVLITTPHSTHAAMTARALEAGKSVLVEKPLALDRAELNRVIRARLKSDAFLQEKMIPDAGKLASHKLMKLEASGTLGTVRELAAALTDPGMLETLNRNINNKLT